MPKLNQHKFAMPLHENHLLLYKRPQTARGLEGPSSALRLRGSLCYKSLCAKIDCPGQARAIDHPRGDGRIRQATETKEEASQPDPLPSDQQLPTLHF